MGDDRKKSWREIDQSRGRASRRRDEVEEQRERASRTHAYSVYRSQLDKLFSPGGTDLPESMKAKLGPQDVQAKGRKTRLAALTKDPSSRTLAPVLESEDPLPRDARLMVALLDVREERLLRAVLVHLEELMAEGQTPNARLLQQRLQALEHWAEDEEVLGAIRRLRERL
ncbi:MAG: hypothetical protein ACFB9M_16670 [Myxococcota bacterium]